MTPIVTLTSDFGTSDGYVGAMKGVILSRAPDARVVDIAHHLPPYDVAASAYCLRQAVPYFPDGTIHVAVVDPGVGTGRRAIIADDGRCLYVAPDNGLLALAVPSPRVVYSIEAAELMRARVSATFHGRDVFAAAAGFLAAGGRASDAGPEVTLAPLRPGASLAFKREEGGALRGAVMYVDRFGNLITNCPAADVAEGATIRVGEQEIRGLCRTFAEAQRGELLAYIGSGDTLEVAVREDSAASILGVGPGAEIIILPADSELRILR